MTIGPVLLDANVLYPAPMRDLLLQLAVEGKIRARWTNEIQQEWIEALLRNEPFRRREALERTRDIMNYAVRDALITDYEGIIPTLHFAGSERSSCTGSGYHWRLSALDYPQRERLPGTQSPPVRNSRAASGWSDLGPHIASADGSLLYRSENSGSAWKSAIQC